MEKTTVVHISDYLSRKKNENHFARGRKPLVFDSLNLADKISIVQKRLEQLRKDSSKGVIRK